MATWDTPEGYTYTSSTMDYDNPAFNRPSYPETLIPQVEGEEEIDFDDFIQDWIMDQLSAEPSEADLAWDDFLLWSIDKAMAAEEDPSLSDAERENLDAQVAQAMTMFESAMARGFEGDLESMYALQTQMGRYGAEGQVSSIGDYAMGDVLEEQARLRSQGAGQIALGRMQAEQNILQGDKAFDLQSQQLGLSGMNIAGSMLGQQDLGQLQAATSIYGGQADRALQAAIASQHSSDLRSASQYGFLGDVVGLGVTAAIMSSSKRHKKNITPVGGETLGLQLYSFEYTDKALREHPTMTLPGKQVGYLAEDVAEVFPDAVIFNEIGQPDAIDYTKLLGGNCG